MDDEDLILGVGVVENGLERRVALTVKLGVLNVLVFIPPDRAERLAEGLIEKARLAKSGLVIPQNGEGTMPA